MKELILLNGKVKTSQIASYKKSDASDYFYIYFKGSPNPYKYNADKVTFLTNPKCLAPEQLKALIAMVKMPKIGRYLAKIDVFDAILAEYRVFFVKINILPEKD